jgi:hypothetical protein
VPRKKSSPEPAPSRKTESFFAIEKRNNIYTSGMRLGDGLATIDPKTHYTNSLCNQYRPTTAVLRALADTLPAQAAIGQIVDGVLSMAFSIKPPEELKNDLQARDIAASIEKSLRHPNREEQDSHRKFISAVVYDLMVGNVAAVEKKIADLSYAEQPIWLWAVNYDNIRHNVDWTPQLAGVVPRYFDTGGQWDNSRWVPLLDENLFLIQRVANSWRSNPPSPIEIAYRMITAWLGLTDFQQHTTSRATQEYLIDLGEVSKAELVAFREFFEVEVLGKGSAPIFGSRGAKGINVVKLGASNDSGLYMQYQEVLLRMIALAFRLSVRDMNLTESDNRATAGVAAELSFQRGILPVAELVMETLQDKVVDFYFPGYQLEFVDTEPRSEADEANVASMLFEKNIITLNEARVRVKEEDVGLLGNKLANGTEISQDIEEDMAQDRATEEEQEKVEQSPATEVKASGRGFGKQRRSKGKRRHFVGVY